MEIPESAQEAAAANRAGMSPTVGRKRVLQMWNGPHRQR